MRSTNVKRTALLPVLLAASLALALPLASRAATSATPTTSAPRVSTGNVSHVTVTSAVLEGHINPRGLATTYYFKYGPTSAYGSQTPPVGIPAGTTIVAVTQTVTGLLAGYHYRLVATNSSGTREGRDRTFSPKVKKVKSEFVLPKTFQPIVLGGTFVLSGTLTGNGNAGRAIVLQSSPYPYRATFADVTSPILTTATGAFSFRVSNLRASTKFRVSTVSGATLDSLIAPVQVQVRVALKVRPSGHPGLVRLYGTVTPAEVGAHVFFQLEKAPSSDEKAGRTEKPSKLEKSGRDKSEAAEKGPTFATVFTTDVKHGTKALSRFTAIVNVREAGHYRAYVEVPAGPLASGHSETVTLRANPNLKQKKKKTTT
jgi:hypothetical protein